MDFQRLKKQFIQYVLIGIVNFGVQSATLLLLSWLTGATQGWKVFLISNIATVVAITNSYILNRLWTFRDHKSSVSKAGLFYGLTIIGAEIASVLMTVIATYIHAPFGLSGRPWLFVANVISVGFSILWNFTAYTQIVFRTPAPVVEAGD